MNVAPALGGSVSPGAMAFRMRCFIAVTTLASFAACGEEHPAPDLAAACRERPVIADYQRPFGPRAPWNIPVRGLATHPQSDLYVGRLWSEGSSRPGDFNLTFDTWTYPVYHVAQATGLVDVSTDWNPRLSGPVLPWNPCWQPASGSDGQVIVLDTANGREWDLFQVRFDGARVHATNGSLVAGDYRTKEDGSPHSRGVGIPYLAMLVRPEEIAAGTIEHALSMPIRNTDGAVFVAPATKLEHPGSRSDGIPEGMRFALRISDAEIAAWVDALPDALPATTRRSAAVIARALRDYGWFITDSSGAAHLQFEDRLSAGKQWQALGLDEVEVGYRRYPRDLLDGLMKPERIVAIVPSDQY